MHDINLNFIKVSCKISAKFCGFGGKSDILLRHNLEEDRVRDEYIGMVRNTVFVFSTSSNEFLGSLLLVLSFKLKAYSLKPVFKTKLVP